MLVELVFNESGVFVAPEVADSAVAEDLLEEVARALVFKGYEVKIRKSR